jgi:peptidoglycan L-alanyl-D-glutamate endopeptidase CwlK
MSSYSTKSKEKLITCEQILQAIFFDALAICDHTILEGHRSPELQKDLYKSGASKVEFGKHNTTPSQAVDASPYPIPDKWGKDNPKEMAKFYFFAGVVKACALKYNREIRWGGDWDNDNDFDDQTFDDLVHFELVPPKEY